MDGWLSLVTVKISGPRSHKGQERWRICYFHGVAAVDAIGSVSDGKQRVEALSPRRDRRDGEISSHLTELSCH